MSRLEFEFADYVLAHSRSDIVALMSQSILSLGRAELPNEPGVYLLYNADGLLIYVGEAKGSKGLKDRVRRKHVSGDESHALQRAYEEDYPDRNERRKFILEQHGVRWVVINDPRRIPVVERLLIFLFRPLLNRI